MNGHWKEEGYIIKLGEGILNKDGTEYVVNVFDGNGAPAGYFLFCHWLNHPVHGEIIHAMEAEVFSIHRRKGIASSVYSLIEERLGLKIHNEPGQQSPLAKALWNSRN